MIEATHCNGIARDGRGPEQLDNEAVVDPLTLNGNVSYYVITSVMVVTDCEV